MGETVIKQYKRDTQTCSMSLKPKDFKCENIDWIGTGKPWIATTLVEQNSVKHKACQQDWSKKGKSRCAWFSSQDICEKSLKVKKLGIGVRCGIDHHDVFENSTKTGYHRDQHWCCDGMVNGEFYRDY